MSWLEQAVCKIDQASQQSARRHQAQLIKPLGSLGCLELLAEQFAGWQANTYPVLKSIRILVFAGDHGVCQQQVSAFPQEVTNQMVINFLEGGAAINVLSEQINAALQVVHMGAINPLPAKYRYHKQLIEAEIAPGTADLSQTAAMSETQMQAALAVGRSIVESQSCELLIGGEMGIGNTTSASAIYAALLSLPPEQVVGLGTGVDSSGLQRKQQVIAKALHLHREYLLDPYQVLRRLGGLEIAGLVGSYIASAQRGVPILVDGFICTAAALLAISLNPGVRDWLLFSHQSAEPAHRLALEELAAKPLVNLNLCLGEGSGAAVVVPLIQSALAVHRRMATFSQAGVSTHV